MFIVFGNTNLTVTGVPAVAKLLIRVPTFKVGLRSFDRAMPQAINHGRWSTFGVVFPPTADAVGNLSAGGISAALVPTGDAMLNAVEQHRPAIAAKTTKICRRPGRATQRFVSATVHHAGNPDSTTCLNGVLTVFGAGSIYGSFRRRTHGFERKLAG